VAVVIASIDVVIVVVSAGQWPLGQPVSL